MACSLTLGRIEPCKDQVGGLNAIYFINSLDLAQISYDTADTDVLSIVSSTVSSTGW